MTRNRSTLKAIDLATPVTASIGSGLRIDAAHRRMLEDGVDLLPVRTGRRVVGAVGRQIVELALFHGLGESRVRELLLDPPPRLPPGASLARLRRVIDEGGESLVLIGADATRITGIVSRDAAGTPRTGDASSRIPDLAARIGQERLARLRNIGRIAAGLGMSVYLVGGFVRDLLLRRATSDIDLVVVGDAIRLGEELRLRLDGELRRYGNFGTATWTSPDGLHIDLSTARSERYVRPAALPRIEPAGLERDLARRDFSVNAMALSLASRGFGVLIDRYGGRRDTRRRMIRALHALSMVEDPTRAFRAVRFAVAMRGKISAGTERAIALARRLDLFAALTPTRLRRELQISFSRPRLAETARETQRLRLWSAVDAGLALDARAAADLSRLERLLAGSGLPDAVEPGERWALVLALIARRPSTREALVRRLQPTRRERRILLDAGPAARRILASLTPMHTPRAGRVHALCHVVDLAAILVAMARTKRPAVRTALRDYLLRGQAIRADIRGGDLRREGIPAGPAIAAGLDAALSAKLDGVARSPEAQLAVALRVARRS